jgi:heme-based aerotactic transducer
MQDARDPLIGDMYKMILSWPDAKDGFSDADLARAKAAQRQYFEDLFGGRVDTGYIDKRRKIGAVHDEKGVRPIWYLAAYSFYLIRFLITSFRG